MRGDYNTSVMVLQSSCDFCLQMTSLVLQSSSAFYLHTTTSLLLQSSCASYMHTTSLVLQSSRVSYLHTTSLVGTLTFSILLYIVQGLYSPTTTPSHPNLWWSGPGLHERKAPNSSFNKHVVRGNETKVGGRLWRSRWQRSC